MIFHLGFELPPPVSKTLDHEASGLTQEEVRILKTQIRRNAKIIHQFIARLDLFVNREKYPNKLEFVEKIRAQLELLMAENDTFRKVLWKQFQSEDVVHSRLPHDS